MASSCSSPSTGKAGPAAGPPALATLTPSGTVDPSKVDVLFMIDDSLSMRDKQELLRDAVPRFIQRLVADAAVNDVHIGVVSSSLGAAGGDTCNRPEEDRQAHLVEEPSNQAVLTWTRATGDTAALTTSLVERVGRMTERGCGYESQLESWYRFLVQPDPASYVTRTNDVAAEKGIDETVLVQRKAFLRPDSKVVIAVLSDENDASVDPLSFGGRAWYFANVPHVKPGTSACSSSPESSACLSCYLSEALRDPRCATALDEVSDPLNLRFFDMQRRFGVDPRFPIKRYLDGLTATRVPNRASEHPANDRGIATFGYVGFPACTNPLFAAALPVSAQEEGCTLALGPRTRDDVLFVVIGGIPNDLLPLAPDGSARALLTSPVGAPGRVHV